MISISKTDKQGRSMVDLASHDFVENRRIFISEEITAATAERFIIELEYLSSESEQDVTVYINSPGGSVTAGLAMLDAMKRSRSRCDIATICTGLAASMAAVLAVCGGTKGKRYITPMGEIMIHQPLGGMQGQASDMEVAVNRILRVKKRLNMLLAEASGQPLEKIAADSERDHYMDAAEAAAYGLVDGIWLGKR